MNKLQRIQLRIADLDRVSRVQRMTGNIAAARRAEQWCVTLMLVESVILRKINHSGADSPSVK